MKAYVRCERCQNEREPQLSYMMAGGTGAGTAGGIMGGGGAGLYQYSPPQYTQVYFPPIGWEELDGHLLCSACLPAAREALKESIAAPLQPTTEEIHK